MSRPTTEQQAVLDNRARIRIVRAVPGSGKTWLVAELIKKELAQWPIGHGGIAALSFTRVGGEEIRRAVRHDVQHPHFVGTLDAFVFRYLIRPFLRQVFPAMPAPRLIPADWAPKHWSNGPGGVSWEIRLTTGKGPGVNLFEACFVGEQNGAPILAYPKPFQSGLQTLSISESARIHKAKEQAWNKTGCMTHSDAAFLACMILTHSQHGKAVRTEMLRRFPLIILDELQDTGAFLGKCVFQLLAEPSARGVLVGDPDQAIYEFNGARPDLFDCFTRIDGAEQLPLGRTRRCCSNVCAVARHLAQPGRQIDPVPDRAGRAFLLTYNDMESEVRRLAHHLALHSPTANVKILARHNRTIERISGLSAKESPKLGSAPLNHLHRAVNYFRRGRQTTAHAASRAALELAVFGHEGISEKEIAERTISTGAWKQVSVQVILEANREVDGETFEAWGKRMADYVQKQLLAIVPPDTDGNTVKAIRLPRGDAKTEKRQEYIAPMAPVLSHSRHIPVQTVHAVKGETHDLTVFVCADANKNNCPSAVWWSSDDADGEERRIAFVAITRTRGDLVVCVSQQTFARLQQHRADFANAFECFSIGEFIAMQQAAVTSLAAQPLIPASASTQPLAET